MKHVILLGSFFLISILHVFAQNTGKEDVVYLKNESVIRGKIISHHDAKLKIQLSDGSILVFTDSEILKTEQEKSYGGYHPAASGFAHYTELGPLVAGKTTVEGVTTAAFSFQTVNGYRIQQYLFAGVGVGIDLYATQTMIPLFASIRGDLTSSGSIIPFYFADAGYAVNITQNSSSSSDFKGGLLYAGGIGVKIPFNRKSGFLISFGYRYQASSYISNAAKKDIEYRRLAIRAGFFL